MGEIFLARLGGVAGFEKLCVIKRILPHLADDERFRQMLIAEAQIVAMMSHANFCHVYEFDETNHQLVPARVRRGDPAPQQRRDPADARAAPRTVA